MKQNHELKETLEAFQILLKFLSQVMYCIDDAPGTSGAGILTQDAKGRFSIFAIASWGSEETNGGCRLTREKIDQITGWIEPLSNYTRSLD